MALMLVKAVKVGNNVYISTNMRSVPYMDEKGFEIHLIFSEKCQLKTMVGS